ncbi:hypothetical protein HanPI659440_Chr08g0279121 [Helianthus annuus]|nr:hypothetical protein HanPI659440_Chr08g0279121 [Helianthus annuus]
MQDERFKNHANNKFEQKKRPETPGVMGSGAFSGVFLNFFFKKRPTTGRLTINRWWSRVTN